ncbi:MAG TPA: hypothetical protein VF041_14535 [Gemmatimonadaceae bacterium]
MPRQRSARPDASSTSIDSMTAGASQPQGAGAESGGAMDRAGGEGQQLAGQVREETKERVESGLSRGKARAATTLGSVARTLRESAQPLRNDNQATAGRYVEQAADRVERLSNYLQRTDVREMVDGIERVARRQPALFLGGAFALGLVGARFLKSSRRARADERGGEAYRRPYGYAGGYAGGYATGAGRTSTGSYGGERDVTGLMETANEPYRRPPISPAPAGETPQTGRP